jgi:hydrogenase maturation protease
MSQVRIFGIGSPAGDDQAGWLTVDALLAGGVKAGDELVIEKLDRPGACLISLLDNASWVILVDAMQSGGQPGWIQRYGVNDWPAYCQGLSSHGFGVLNALLLARELGSLPPRLDLYGIEVGGALPGGNPCSEVRTATRKLADIIADELCFILQTRPAAAGSVDDGNATLHKTIIRK